MELKCYNCGSKRLFHSGEESFLCMDCRFFHEIEYKKVDDLSWWLWSREYNKNANNRE